jgi:hypothetical protein
MVEKSIAVLHMAPLEETGTKTEKPDSFGDQP